MRGEFKVGDHVSWNSEAGRVRGNHPTEDHGAHQVQGLHGARLAGGAAVPDRER